MAQQNVITQKRREKKPTKNLGWKTFGMWWLFAVFGELIWVAVMSMKEDFTEMDIVFLMAFFFLFPSILTIIWNKRRVSIDVPIPTQPQILANEITRLQSKISTMTPWAWIFLFLYFPIAIVLFIILTQRKNRLAQLTFAYQQMPVEQQISTRVLESTISPTSAPQSTIDQTAIAQRKLELEHEKEMAMLKLKHEKEMEILKQQYVTKGVEENLKKTEIRQQTTQFCEYCGGRINEQRVCEYCGHTYV